MKQHAKFAGGSTAVGALALLVMFGCERAPQTEAGAPTEGAPAAAEKSAPARGTIEEARVMLAKAADHYAAVGRTQALQNFTAKMAPFSDRDLYVFCFGPDSNTSAHGADAGLIGKPAAELLDVDGQAFATRMLELANVQPNGGEVQYKWRNPVSGEVEPKVSVFRKFGEDVCGVGAYQPNATTH